MRDGHLTNANKALKAITLSLGGAIAAADRLAQAGEHKKAIETLLDYDRHFDQALTEIKASHKSKEKAKYPEAFADLDTLELNIRTLYEEMGRSIANYTQALNPIPQAIGIQPQPQPPIIIAPGAAPVGLPQPAAQLPAPAALAPIDPDLLVISLPIREQHNKDYAIAYLRLAALKFLDVPHTTILAKRKKQHLDALLQYVETLNDTEKESIVTLTTVLEDTALLLQNDKDMTPKEYHKRANAMQGNPSLALNILGGLMVALAVAAMAAAITVAAMSLGLMLIITSASTSAAAFLVGGGSLFGARRTGVSKDMMNVAHDEVALRKQGATM